MNKRFDNRTVVVTGAGGGLGRALALGFAGEGAYLILVDVDDARLEETAACLHEEGARCSKHHVDLAVEDEIKQFGAAIGKEHPQIHVLCNNAGIAYGEINEGFAEVRQDRWLHFLAINSIAPLILGQALRSSLAKAKGAIINQSSMASYMPAVPYGVTKATLNAITYGMATVFASDGIRVNAVAPGIMETPANKASLSPETYAQVQAMQLLPLHGTADDIVQLTLFLASDQARFITNEIVHCDAGNRMRGYRD